MEYVRNGNIAHPWRLKEEPAWDAWEITIMLYQCLHALMYLHAKPTVIHRDIKPENILVDHRYPAPKVKIGDFGIAKEGSKAEGISGTWTYTAPEAFSGEFIPRQTPTNQHRHPGPKTYLGARGSSSALSIFLCVKPLTSRMRANL